MEVVKFLNHTWQEIPDQDNPAMQCNMVKDPNNFGALINHECIMIFKGRREYYRITDGGFVVARALKEGDIISLGVFWRSENAELFADMIAGQSSPELFEGTNKALDDICDIRK